MSLTENAKSLPPPWDRIFSLGTRTFVWGLLLAVLYILSSFLLLIFLTFVFSYIQAHGVDGLAHRIRSRPLRVTIVGLVFLGTLFATGFTLAPQVNEQASNFWRNRETYIAQADAQLDKTLRQWPALYDPLLKHQKMARESQNRSDELRIPGGGPRPGDAPPGEVGRQPEGNGATPGGETAPGEGHEDGQQGQEPGDGRKPGEGQEPGGAPKPGDGQEPGETPKPAEGQKPGQTPAKANGEAQGSEGEAAKPKERLQVVQDAFDEAVRLLGESTFAIGQSVLGYASAFLLALLFSFLIVLDLPKIKRGIAGLASTKVGFIYEEVADNIAGFGRVLGRALEAQLFIAIVNTILTAIGIWMLDLPNLLVLSTIVFFCSFIPVAGTFMSSTPICLLALQTGGVTTMLLAVLLICIIHAIETYVLNPQIYGHHMHMNPVVVLIVLTVGGKLFGVWGLLLGIPVVNYIWRHAIRRPEERPAET